MDARSRTSVAIVQSCYIPWKGYFDLIGSVDEFVLYDDQQYTRRDWRNRNRIKTPHGTRWLSIPVKVKGRYLQRIDETEIDDPEWAEKHWLALTHAYRRAPHFDTCRDRIEDLYRGCTVTLLSQVNRRFLEAICEILGIDTRLTWSTDYEASGRKTERLVDICLSVGATEYVSGPSAAEYLDRGLFDEAGIALRYIDYWGYPEYEQLHPPFEHAVTILDLLFHTGPEAPRYLRSVPRAAAARHA